MGRYRMLLALRLEKRGVQIGNIAGWVVPRCLILMIPTFPLLLELDYYYLPDRDRFAEVKPIS